MASPNAVQYNSNGFGATPTSQVNSRDVRPQYPEMDVVPADKPLLEALGAPGTAIFSGIITSEEYNPDWYWRDGIKIIEQMVRNDPQIAATRKMLELPIRRAKWSIVPGSDSPQDQEIASFVQSCLFDEMQYQTASGRTLHQKWDDTLRHILMHLTYGFMAFEQNWRIEDGWVKWARWTPLLPRSVWRWWVGADNELAGIQQWTFKNYAYGFVNIPADKLLLFAHQQEGNNYEGVSIFRSAYKPWWYKENFEKIDAIGIERNAVSIPVVHLPANATNNDGAQALSIGQNMRANEMGAVVMPFGWDVEYPKNNQKYSAQVLPSIQYHDIMIARNVLCQFLNLGSTETGAYSLDRSQVNTFLSSLQAVCEYIEDVINNDAIRRLVDYNFDNVEVYPKLQCEKLTAQNTEALAESLSKLMQGTTPLLQPDPVMQDWLLDQFGVPHAPIGTVESTNPSSPTTPERPQNQRAADHGNEQSTNSVPGKNGDSQSVDEAGADAADGGAATSELVEESRLLRETLERVQAMDAVERGLTFSNPYPRQKGGLFGFGGPGHGAHIGGHVGGAGHHGGEGHPSEHDVTGGAHTGGGSGGTGHGGGASRNRGTAAAHHERLMKPGSEYDAHALSKTLGHEKMRAGLEKYTHGDLRRVAASAGVKPARTKEETINRIMTKVGEKGHESEKSTRATRAAKGKAADEGKAHELTPEERAARGLKAEVKPGENQNSYGGQKPLEVHENITPAVKIAGDPSLSLAQRLPAITELYGEHQVGVIVAGHSLVTVRETAKELGLKSGGTKDELVSRITSHVTEGRYHADFGVHGKATSDEAHAAKVKSLETRIAKAQATLDSLKAQHAALTGGKGSKKASELEAAIDAETIHLSELLSELEDLN